MPESFEGFLKERYWEREKFREAVERSAKREGEEGPQSIEEKISSHLKRIERILEKERGKKLFRETILYPRFIIKPENISEDYLKGIVLGNFAEQRGYQREQLKNPEIRKIVIQLFEKERGVSFETYRLPEEETKRLKNQIIEDQKRSLNLWLDYLTSPEAKNYPPAFRYWVFAEMLKLGSYDSERKEFNKRTEKTVAPFPELNQQALSLVLDEILRKYEGKPSSLILSEEQKKEFGRRLQSENFNKLYSWAIEYVKSLKTPEERLRIIEGEWRVFKQGSDPRELSKALQGFNTGWCIAGEATAASYLSDSDIHIFFSKDEKGQNTIPRLAIVSRGATITEIRGIAKDQNLDPYITPVLEKKLEQIPGGQKWREQTEQMKKLTDIYFKHLQKQELSIEELKFLYEIDKKIRSFGWQKDPRIEQMRKERDPIKDLNQIFSSQREFKGNLDLSFLTSAEGLKLPERISGNLDLSSLTSAKGLELPREVGGSLDLSFLTSAEGLKLPERVGGHLNLSSLTSAEGLKLPERVSGSLFLASLTSAEGLKLPREIGGNLNLQSLTSAKGLKLPERIGGCLFLHNLVSAEGLELPRKVGGIIYVPSLSPSEIYMLRKKFLLLARKIRKSL